MRQSDVGRSAKPDNTESGTTVYQEKLNSPYNKFCFVDTAFGNIKFRNNLKKIEEVGLPNPPLECYISMFRFGEEFKEHCEKTGSVRNADHMPCYCDYLWFDIDDDNLEAARIRAIDLLVRIESGYQAQAVLYFSGSKGFHIGIPSKSFGATPRPNLPQVFKRMAPAISGDIKIDTSIYDKNRLWRLSNSINGKSMLYKIPLTHEELARLDEKAIKELAAGQRDDIAATSSAHKRSGALTALYDNTVRELGQPKRKTNVRPGTRVSRKLCIERILEGVDEGLRNEAGIRLADHFEKEDCAEEEALRRLLEWNERNMPPLSDTEIEQIIGSTYTGNYDYGCNDSFLKSMCSPDCPLKKKEKKDQKPTSTSCVVLSDGTILEMLYDKNADPLTFFARFKDGKVEYIDSCADPLTGTLYHPVKPGKIIQSLTIHFPTCVEEYGVENDLIERIDKFISKYLIVSPFFHTICKYYVLLSWVYDNFTVIPYLRVRGDLGTGKTRFLQAVGSLCYKPLFCMGATTVSPIFRLIDTYRGTVIIDESDFNESDESHRIVKILNSGFQKGFPVLLTETVSQNRLEPMSFDVFGPKLIASRREFKDKALESRCITEMMDKAVARDIPIDLPLSFWDEAQEIRNMLLLWRFRKWGKISIAKSGWDIPIEPRLQQITIPLLSIIDDERVKKELVDFMKKRSQQMIEERGETLDGKVAEAACELWTDETMVTIRVKDIADRVKQNLDNPDFKFTSRKAGGVLRKTFNLSVTRDGKGYFLERSSSNLEKLANIARKYGIEFNHAQERSQCSQCASPVAGQRLTL